jgi:hypothetical protein
MQIRSGASSNLCTAAIVRCIRALSILQPLVPAQSGDLGQQIEDEEQWLSIPAYGGMATDQKGVSAFPNLTPLGGSINGITVLISDGVTAGNVILADASGIAGASGDVVLNEFREGSFQSDTAPDSPISASITFIKLHGNCG